MKDDQNGWRQEKRSAIEKFFVPENLVPGSNRLHSSPSEKYTLSIDLYSAGPNALRYSRGIVSDANCGRIIADIKRNLDYFWHCWVRHPNGQEYFLSGEDYQGYEVVELASGKINIYLPDSAKNGSGFCWAKVYPSNDGTVLAVQGCIWGGPYDMVFYDFSKPLNLPLPEIGRIEEIGQIIGWKSDSIFSVEHDFMVRTSDNRRFESLSEREQEEYNENEYAFSFQTEVLHWNKLTRSLVG
jgi:hypothetical protein